jgi:hypothetical protein
MLMEKARAKETCARDFEGSSSTHLVQKKNFQSHKSKSKNKNKSVGKGKFDGKNKPSKSTNLKKSCHVWGDPNRWALNFPNLYDKRLHGNGGNTVNVVVG